MAKVYKLWAQVEVYDDELDEHTTFDPDRCEFKIFEGDKEGAIAFLNSFGYEDVTEEINWAAEFYGVNE